MVMMDKPRSVDLPAFTDRRLHPVRLGIGHLNRLLVANKGNATVTVDRALLESVTATLEIFVEDFEMSYRPTKEEKKTLVEQQPRVTQTRVS